MANEYLKRTPTSTGNRKVFTISVWAKFNSITNGNTISDTFGNETNFFTIRVFDTTFGGGPGVYQIDSGVDYSRSWNSVQRDFSSWSHHLFVFNSPSIDAGDRVVYYHNGVRITNYTDIYGTFPQNFDFKIDTTRAFEILRNGDQNTYGKGEMFDYFFIDGQALTPDVFGFYKEGKGYISAGSSQATDFRPGQWVPKTPRVIKTEINRRGGFGVNGFYLPMNDSSNFGADFHTTPNSIITLKGEDLPQPRNGLPTTSDDYVSQLRSDPYAANLILAVPGVNTQPTGSELVTNGTFDTDVSGWTITDTGTLVRQSDGTVEVTRGTDAKVAYQDITTVVGTTYELSVDITAIAGSHGQIYVYSTDHSGNIDTNIGYSFYTGTYKGTFTADTTTTRIALYAHPSGSTSYDNISIKATTIPDYSADIKGSGTNKTLTPVGDVGIRDNDTSGSAVNGYYGSALSFDGSGDYLSRTYDADFNFGTSDFTVEMWVYANTVSSIDGLFAVSGGSGGNPKMVFHLNSGTPSVHYNGLTGAADIYTASGAAIPAGQWSHLAYERKGSTWTWYINGVATGTGSNSTDITFTNQPMYIGYGGEGYFDSLDGKIQDLRVYKGVAKYKGGFDVPKPYTPVGIATWRAVPDTTANNFATLNPISSPTGSDSMTNGNLDYTGPSAWRVKRGTIQIPTTGKWYFEARLKGSGANNTYNGSYAAVGVSTDLAPVDGSSGISTTSNLMLTDTGIVKNFTTAALSFFDNTVNTGSALSSGDIISIQIDRDANTYNFLNNGVSINSGTMNITANIPLNVIYISYSNSFGQMTMNFGQNPTFSGNTTAGTYTDSNGKGLFKYEPPTGFLALCEDNLPTPAIADPGKYFKTVLWTGSGTYPRNLVGIGFTPDLIWVKNRNNADFHRVYDSVRGVKKAVYTNSTAAEQTDNLISFDSDGFSFEADSYGGGINDIGEGHVSWCWKAGGAAVSNTDGTITSQVSANQTAGFSIATFTGNATAGATVGHGLGKTPSFFIVKKRDGVGGDGWDNWNVYHRSIGNTGVLFLQSTAATLTNIAAWNNTSPTSSVVSLGYNAGAGTNGNNINYVMYSWAEIEGFSKFRSYVGNGSADGPFVYCGFKPAWILYKRIESVENWEIFDSSRQSTNPAILGIKANTFDTEAALLSNGLDLLSNGFKIRENATRINASGGTYIFAAFAESPFKTANAK